MMIKVCKIVVTVSGKTKSNTNYTSNTKDVGHGGLDQKYQSLTATVKLDPNCKATPNERRSSSNSDISTNNKKSAYVDVNEEDVKALMDNVTKEEDEFKIIEEVMPISLNVFWENFLSDNAKYGIQDFLAEKGERDIVMQNWKQAPTNEETKGGATPPSPKAESQEDNDENKEKGKEDEPRVEKDQPQDKENLTRDLNFVANVRGVPF